MFTMGVFTETLNSAGNISMNAPNMYAPNSQYAYCTPVVLSKRTLNSIKNAILHATVRPVSKTPHQFEH